MQAKGEKSCVEARLVNPEPRHVVRERWVVIVIEKGRLANQLGAVRVVEQDVAA
jgi:hypothetical protein